MTPMGKAEVPSQEVYDRAYETCKRIGCHERHKEDIGHPPRNVPVRECSSCRRIATLIMEAERRGVRWALQEGHRRLKSIMYGVEEPK